jgi:hypothetical protein
MKRIQDLREVLGEDVPHKYIEQVIAETDIKDSKQRVTYEDFLNMWRQELEDRQMRAWRGISKQRTVTALAEEMLATSSDDEGISASAGSDDSEYKPISSRLVSIAEREQKKSKSSNKLSSY